MIVASDGQDGQDGQDGHSKIFRKSIACII